MDSRNDIPYPHPILAREGWPYIVGSLVVTALVAWLAGPWWALPLAVIALFVIQFFRDPPRQAPAAAPGQVLAPADGRIVTVGRHVNPYTGQDCLKISIFMNVFNVHSNRSPVDGTVQRIEYFRGAFVNADLDKASEANERNALVIRCDDGFELTCVQVAGLVARRILCYVKAGEHVSRGQRFGFIRFGSRVDVYLPVDARPCVAIGDRVSATTTAIAQRP